MQSSPVVFFFAFVAVLALIGLAAWLVRRFGVNRLGTNANRGRMPRLAVIDAAAVDGRRRLVLVRRDNVEHLLMIGGPTDIVVEPNIVRATPSRDQLPQRPVGAETAPRVAPLETSWEPEAAELPEPQMPELPPRLPRPQPQRPVFAEDARRPSPPVLEPRGNDPLSALIPDIMSRPDAPTRPEPMLRAEPPLRVEQPMRVEQPLRVEPPLRPEPVVRAEPPQRPEPAPRPEPRLDAPSPRPSRPEPMMPRPMREPSLKGTPRAIERPAPQPAPPAPAAAAPSAADQNLADMAQRLEAALRRPSGEARQEHAEPRVGAPPVAPESPSRSQPAAAAEPPPPDVSVKSGFESLEDEMASLLGRTKTPS